MFKTDIQKHNNNTKRVQQHNINNDKIEKVIYVRIPLLQTARFNGLRTIMSSHDC